MLEAISSLDDALMEKLLEEQMPSREEVFATLTKGFRGDQIVPVLLGSADKDLGVRRLLKLLRHEAPEAGTPPGAWASPPRLRAPGPGLEDRQRPAHRQAVPGAGLARRAHRGHDPQRRSAPAPSPSPSAPSRRRSTKAGPGEIVALGRMDTVKTGDVLTTGNAADGAGLARAHAAHDRPGPQDRQDAATRSSSPAPWPSCWTRTSPSAWTRTPRPRSGCSGARARST